MIIDKPGFYTSKAGKCEVVAINGSVAIGWANDGPAYWHCDSGVQFGGTWWRNDITGPWVEPRKPVEGYVYVDRERQIITPNELPLRWSRVLVREVEDSNDNG